MRWTAAHSSRATERRTAASTPCCGRCWGSNQPLARAATLPAAAYTAEAFFQLAAERIFRRDWLVIDHVSLPLALGDYFPLDLLGEMIVVASGSKTGHNRSPAGLRRPAPSRRFATAYLGALRRRCRAGTNRCRKMISPARDA
jgi:hypothetical protein